MPLVPPPDLMPALPEIVLAGAAMALLLLGVFRGEGSSRLVSWLSVAALIGPQRYRPTALRDAHVSAKPASAAANRIGSAACKLVRAEPRNEARDLIRAGSGR